MSFSVKLYQISAPEKKIDKSLTSAHEREITGVLYQDVEDVNAPALEFDKSIFTAPAAGQCTFWTCNYAYISEMGRYYFVTGKTIVDNDHAVLQLRTDVLKTYATAIKGTTAWIERSASAGSWYLPDGMIPMDSQLSETPSNTAYFPFDLTPNSGKPSYVVKTAGGSIPSALGDGPAKYIKNNFLSPCTSVFAYALTRDNTLKLADEISSTAFLQHWFDDLQSGVFSLMAFPFEIDYTAADLTPIIVSTTSLVTGGYPLKSPTQSSSLKSALNTNLQISLPSDFRISTGDYVIRIFLPFVGWQTLDPAVFKIRQYLNVEYKTNLLSGTGVCTVYAVSGATSVAGNSDIIAQYEYVAGMEIPITINTSIEVTKNAINTAMSSLLAVAGAVVTENPALIGGALASGAINMTRAMTTPVKTGSLGSSSFSNNPLYQQAVLLQYRKRTSPVLDDDSQKNLFASCHGLRCDQAMTVSGNSGFIKCANWWMNPPSGITEAELKEIENHMESGVIV